jgi:O-antigen ligase
MKNKIFFCLNFLIGLLFVFPLFKENISTLFIILTTLFTIIYLVYNKIHFTFRLKHALYIIPFLIILATNIFAVNSDFDIKNVSKSLMFLIFPIIFINIPSPLFKTLESHYLYLFKVACLVICFFYIGSFLMLYSINDFFAESFNESIFRKYVYNQISIFKIHPTYFSLFLNLGIVHSIVKMRNEKLYLNLFFFLFFTLMILLLSSKIMIVFSVFSTVFILIFKNQSQYKKYFIVMILTFFIGSVFVLPGIKSRFIESYNDFKNPPRGLYFNSTNIRSSIYECSLTILKENYIKGVGFSNVQKELNNCYKLNYDSSFYENHDYLTHNYFLYIFIGSGLLGFLFFIIYLLVLVKKCIQINNIILNITFLNCIILCFVEDFLYRHYGLFFFNLIFFSYLKFYEHNLQENALNEQ